MRTRRLISSVLWPMPRITPSSARCCSLRPQCLSRGRIRFSATGTQPGADQGVISFPSQAASKEDCVLLFYSDPFLSHHAPFFGEGPRSSSRAVMIKERQRDSSLLPIFSSVPERLLKAVGRLPCSLRRRRDSGQSPRRNASALSLLPGPAPQGDGSWPHSERAICPTASKKRDPSTAISKARTSRSWIACGSPAPSSETRMPCTKRTVAARQARSRPS